MESNGSGFHGRGNFVPLCNRNRQDPAETDHQAFNKATKAYYQSNQTGQDYASNEVTYVISQRMGEHIGTKPWPGSFSLPPQISMI